MKFTYSTAPDIGDPLLKRLGTFPRVPDVTRDTLRWLGGELCVAFLKAQYKVVVEGTIPEAERLAFVANHQSHLDTITFLAALPAKTRNEIAALAAEDYFFRRPDRAIAAAMLCQAVAFDRLHKSALRQWWDHLKTLETGTVLFYPSGSRNSKTLQAGLLKLFVQSGWTIVPVRLDGTKEAWPSGDPVWKPFKQLKVTFLEPHKGGSLDQLLACLDQGFKERRIDGVPNAALSAQANRPSPQPEWNGQ